MVRVARIAVERLNGQDGEVASVFQELRHDLNTTCFRSPKNDLILHLYKVQAFGVNDLGRYAESPVSRRHSWTDVRFARKFVSVDFRFVVHGISTF